jgi:hypothetical protein
VINASIAPTETVNVSATTAAECQSLVRRNHPEANAAEYSNTGGVWCKAVFNATGVIYDPQVQTCIFSEIPEDIQRKALEGGMDAAAVVMAADPLAFLRIMH